MSVDLVLPHAYTPTAGALTSRLPIHTANARLNRIENNTPVGEATKAVSVPFTRIPDAVLLDPRLTPVHFRIYTVIARRAARETASAFPSYATIAKDANISRTSAINGVAALVSFGYLVKQSQQSGQGDPTSNRYTISGEGSQIFVPRRPNIETLGGEAVQNLDCPDAELAPQVVQPFDHRGAIFVPELD